MSEQPLRIASRRSPLAMRQADIVAQQLQQCHPALQIEIIPFVTEGDRILDQPLNKIGGKGLFVNALEKALLNQEADIAVHSSKDLPTCLPAGLSLSTVCSRADPRDAWVSRQVRHPSEHHGSIVVGTSSLRRQCQLAHQYPHLTFKSVRGNVQTRLAKLDRGEVDALILAVAGLERLGLADHITHKLAPSVCLPAMGQGTLAIESRSVDTAIKKLLQPLEDQTSRWRLTAERAFNQKLGGSCQVPIAAYATLTTDQPTPRLQLKGLVGKPDGSMLLQASIQGDPEQAQQLGEDLADQLIVRGAMEIIKTCLNLPH
jgi:hydroxymethylbilane synthase